MDLDAIFSVLFIVVIVVFQLFGGLIRKIARRRADTKEANKKPQRPGLFDTIIRRIKEEIEAAREAALTPPPSAEQPPVASRSASGWNALMPSEPAETEDAPAPTRKPLSAFDASHETPAVKSGAKPPSPQTRPREIGHPLTGPKTSALYQEPAKKAMPSTYSRTDPSLQKKRTPHHERILELRRAVVWTEIFAPPLALRNDKNERW